MEKLGIIKVGRSKWLDHIAIGMAAVCAVHCLLMPILITILPIIATSFIVHQDFHLWMIFFVLPTTGFAIFIGCRSHKDRGVFALSAIGLSILVFDLVYERIYLSGSLDVVDPSSECGTCLSNVSKGPVPMQAGVWLNAVGGLLLASAHIRNFRLCRSNCCKHDRN